ncbi:MAG: AMP-binding protein [Clostridia bacterium]|nr:AMP-binding protein [Clostridia bacterium]
MNNFLEFLTTTAQKYSNNIAFKIKNGKEYKNITYTQFMQDCIAFARAYKKSYPQSKRVAVIGKNCYEWIVGFLGVQLAGVSVVPLDKGLSPAEVKDQLYRIEADSIIFGQDYTEMSIQKEGISRILMYGSEDISSVEKLIIAGEQLEENLPEQNGERTCIYLFTSGTTSKSKIVMLSQRNILSNIEDMLLCEKFYEWDVNLALLPFHHTFGMTGILVFLTSGTMNVFCEGLRIQKALNEYSVTTLVGVPLILDNIKRMINRKVKKEGKYIPFLMLGYISRGLKTLGIDVRRKLYSSVHKNLGGALRLIISGAAPLAPETANFFNNMGILTIQGYGMTETAPVIAAEDPIHRKAGSVGLPMKSVEVEIISENGEKEGEIVVKGPNVMQGYYDAKEMTEKAMEGGFFHTGDVGYMDKDGYLFITGRLKNIIVLENGKKVYPEEVEFQLSKIEYIKEAVVYNDKVGKKDCVSAKIVIDLEEISYEQAEKELEKDIADVNKRLASFKQIKNYHILTEELEKTTTGKIKR